MPPTRALAASALAARPRRAVRCGGVRSLPARRLQPDAARAAAASSPPRSSSGCCSTWTLPPKRLVWRRVGGAQVECVLSLGADAGSRRIRAAARAAISGRGGLSLVGRSTLRAVQVRRFGEPAGAIVISVFGDPRRDVSAYLDAAAAALVARARARSSCSSATPRARRALVAAGEKRLMRLGFDLHDGPIQDVLALAGETQRLRDQIYPFVLESHRELALRPLRRHAGAAHRARPRVCGRSRTRSRRRASSRARSPRSSTARSTRSRSARASRRPSRFAATRSRSAPRSGSRSSGPCRSRSRTCASTAAPPPSRSRIRARRSTIDVRVTDNGHGFEVSRGAGAGSAARPARPRRDRRARAHARRHVRDRQPPRRADEPPLLVAAVGAVHGRRRSAALSGVRRTRLGAQEREGARPSLLASPRPLEGRNRPRAGTSRPRRTGLLLPPCTQVDAQRTSALRLRM